jgi:AcrR family transcriptional regulator
MNHVMTTAAPPSELRQDHVNATRRRIAAAVVETIAADGPARLSFPAVAERAGVSLRTVYRHFPNKDLLLTAAFDAGSERFRAAFPVGTRRLDAIPELVPALFADLYANRDLVLVQHTSPEGAALRGERMRQRRGEIAEVLRPDTPGLTEVDRTRLADLVTVLVGSSMLFDLVDQLGLTVEEAAALTVFAVQAVADRAKSKGEVR